MRKEAKLQTISRIANNPDYDALAPGRDFSSGTPVVSFGTIPADQFGKVIRIRTFDGTKYYAQYAVIEANDCLSSHDAYGIENQDYFSDDPSKMRAIAGNSRITGLQEAYKLGNANVYKTELIADSDHGVDPEVIRDMKAPVLVRVMQTKDVTSEIGYKSSTVNNPSMTAPEIAFNDSQRVDFSKFKTDEDGEPTVETIKNFVSMMPLSEQCELLNRNGEPTRQALRRLKDAAFAKAYENDRLIAFYTQETDPKARSILKSLELAASDMARLNGLKDGYDIRDLVADAVTNLIVDIKNRHRDLTDIFKSKEDNRTVTPLNELFSQKNQTPLYLGSRLRELAKACYIEGTRTEIKDLFFAPAQKRLSLILRDIAKFSKHPTKMSDKALKFWQTKGGDLVNAIFNDDSRSEDRLFLELRESLL